MTRARLRALVRHYVGVLGLSHWQIDCDFDTPLSPGRDAEVGWAYHYDEATIRFAAREWRAWDEETARGIVAHELLHVFTRDLCVAAQDAISHLPKRAQPLAEQRWDHELEGVVERLARVIV